MRALTLRHQVPRKTGAAGRQDMAPSLLIVRDERSLEFSQCASWTPGNRIAWGCWLICRNVWVPTQIC